MGKNNEKIENSFHVQQIDLIFNISVVGRR
jgi:hypothetical protein